MKSAFFREKIIMTAIATTTPEETPFLDRDAPLPPRAMPGSGLAVVLTPWFGAIVLLAACWILDRPPILREWFLTDFRDWLLDRWAGAGVVGVGVSVVAAFYLMVAVHELGHLVAGSSVGFRGLSFRVGPLIRRPFQVSLYRGPGAVVNGVAELVPVATDKLAGRGAVMILGGPAANLLSALVMVLLPFPITIFSGCFIAFSIANGVNDLFPFESRLGVSDGRRIWMLLRERGERWLALLRLGSEINYGALPESLSADFLAKAIAVRDDSVDTMTAHAIAYWAAFHQHKDREAGQLLETSLAYSRHASPVIREALMSDAAVFLARKRKRADLAEQWLADIPVDTKNQWFRSRAEAAILEAKGDVGGAVEKLAEVEAAILKFPENAQRETRLQLLQRWKSDLGRH